MSILHLLYGRFINLKFGFVPIAIFIFASVRTLLSGNAIMFTGLTMAFLPFFSQQKNLTCFAVEVTEEKEMFSLYLMYYIITFTGLGYLYGLTLLGQNYIPNYQVNELLLETFLLVILCDLAFINILVPLLYALDTMQSFTIACLLVVLEFAFMKYALFTLNMLGPSFCLAEQTWLYVLMIVIPQTTIEFTVLRWWQRKKIIQPELQASKEEILELMARSHKKY